MVYYHCKPRRGFLKTEKFNFMGIVNYFKGSIEELKKVVWPTKKEATTHTLLVIGISVAIAFLLGFLDYIFNLGLEKLLQR